MLRGGLTVLAGFLLVAAGLFVKLAADFGAFRSISPHFAGSCVRVTGALGPEDLTIDRTSEVAYVSSYDRRATRASRPVAGAIWSYDLNRAEPELVNLTPDAGPDFHPHGISLYVGEDGTRRLFVINHPPHAPHEVRSFDLVDGRLLHHRTVSDAALLVTPNDLVAVGPESFYLTNTHAAPPGRAQLIETLLRRADANVVFFDGSAFRPAIEHLVFPNGIATSPDGRTLYVATTTLGELLVFDRDPASEQLAPRSQLELDSGLDNIDVDEHGALWIGAHPKLFDMRRLATDPEALSPSQVLRVRPGPDGELSFDEVYLDSGSEISGLSVAAVHGQRMLLGEIFGDGILDCTLGQGG